MRFKFLLWVAIFSLAAICSSSCGGDALDYETAMTLVRERASDPVRATFSASPRFDSQDAKVTEAYQRLIEAHVIQCHTNVGIGTFCEPGPAGNALTQNGVTDLSLVAGRWVPSSILAIRRTGSGSAQADVRLSFEPSELFRDFEDALDQIQAPVAMLSLASRKQGKVAKVIFQRYEDGWHVESIE